MKRLKLSIGKVLRSLLVLNIFVMILYFVWWLDIRHIDNPYLYILLLIGEIYHIIMSITFWFTLKEGSQKKLDKIDQKNFSVDIFITVVNEPIEVLRETVIAAKNIEYDNKKIYLLNDGYVAKNPKWQDVEELAKELDVLCITRKLPGGAKAGNINNALIKTRGDLVVIFDTDMKPTSDFLKETVSYFKDPKTGFVQTPQYYINYEENLITAASWNQQEIFFGPIMTGKDKSNASFICGTNVVIRREALLEVGGMDEVNIAEDFLTSLAIHKSGWKSYYVNKVLAYGMAPLDMGAYYKQQFRWARGSLEVLFSHNPLFDNSLKIEQKVEYLSSALYYLNGVVVFIDAIMPILLLFFGLQAVNASTTSFALYFIPFVMLNLYTLYLVMDENFPILGISFSHSSWALQILALISVLAKKKMSFSVTPKSENTAAYWKVVFPHLVYIGAFFIATTYALGRDGVTASIITNVSWGMFNIFMFIPFIYASLFDTKNILQIRQMNNRNYEAI